VNDLRVIALTHKNLPLETIGKFHLAGEQRKQVLASLQEKFGITEVMYLSTCNRVEIIFSLSHFVCPGVTHQILQFLRPDLGAETLRSASQACERYNGAEAVEHILRVASSLDSVVIGEREIITQLRKAYEECDAEGTTGDDLRLLIRQAIKTAKEIFTYTDLSKKPVSVVSLAWQQFRDAGYPTSSKILLVGAGQIIRNFCKFLSENGYHNLVVANRTLAHAETLVTAVGGKKALSLNELPNYSEGFDVLVSCTGSTASVIDLTLYERLLQGDHSKKMIIDLALPADVDAAIVQTHAVQYIDMPFIQSMASANISFREQALTDCEPLIQSGIREFERSFNERRVEKAMRSIPDTIKEIKSTALGTVFAQDLEKLDENSREVLEKILQYMEKKYISVPMKMAREVLLDAVSKN
jgi:glutamyl-tRNA reductase